MEQQAPQDLACRWREQLVPRTSQRLVDADQRCHQDVNVTRFDLLHGAQVQVRLLRQLLLGDLPGTPFPSDVGSKELKLQPESAAGWHAPLRRVYALELNGVLGRNSLCDCRCSRVHGAAG